MKHLALLLLVACTSRPPAPMVHLVIDHDNDATPDEVYLNAARGWEPLGFDFAVEATGMPECARDWFKTGEVDCEITLYLYRVPNLVESAGTSALNDNGTISIDTKLTGDALDNAVAHEVGHTLLNTGTHTKGGIMGGVSDRMWDVDYKLACETINICEDP